jgi:hypothetical protein
VRVFVWVLLAALVLAAGGSVAWRFLTAEQPYRFDTKSLRMEVVNCSGVQRAGRAVADELQMRGYDVYGVLGGTEQRERSVVEDLRDPRGRGARELAQSLRVRRHLWRFHYGSWLVPPYRVRLDSSRYLEVRLVLGADFRKYFPAVIPLH